MKNEAALDGILKVGDVIMPHNFLAGHIKAAAVLGEFVAFAVAHLHADSLADFSLGHRKDFRGFLHGKVGPEGLKNLVAGNKRVIHKIKE